MSKSISKPKPKPKGYYYGLAGGTKPINRPK